MPTIKSAVSPTPRAQILLTARGLIAENYPILASNSSGTVPGSQTVQVTAIGLRAGDVVTNIVTNVTQSPAGTTPTNMWLGLYDSSSNLLGQTATLAATSNWATTGYVAQALTAAYTVTADGLFYPAVLINGSWGTTQLNLARVALGASQNSLAFGSNPRLAWQQAGQTTLPTGGTPAATSVAFWMGVS